ncbi:hypothetical protein N7445_001313 [Penicillium cf. griseofulvum]|nr:hypothetical protein N7445_001313 [Penicillium cf. griseofulvum]
MSHISQDYCLFSAAACVSEFDQLRSGPKATRPKFMIYKVSDDNQILEVEETSLENDYDAFRFKLSNAADKDGNPAPRYALYHMNHDLGRDGKHKKILFIRWLNCHAPLGQCLSYLRRMQFDGVSDLKILVIDADCSEDLEWEVVLEKFIEHIP